jgi:ABC-type branched-subunit amino acid transport system ATPase component
MARALMPGPEMLLLDEPSAGLAPSYVTLVFEKILEIRAEGVTILVVEQNARRSLALSDRGYVLELGQNRFQGRGEELLGNETVVELYLGRRAKAEA